MVRSDRLSQRLRLERPPQEVLLEEVCRRRVREGRDAGTASASEVLAQVRQADGVASLDERDLSLILAEGSKDVTTDAPLCGSELDRDATSSLASAPRIARRSHTRRTLTATAIPPRTAALPARLAFDESLREWEHSETSVVERVKRGWRARTALQPGAGRKKKVLKVFWTRLCKCNGLYC